MKTKGQILEAARLPQPNKEPESAAVSPLKLVPRHVSPEEYEASLLQGLYPGKSLAEIAEIRQHKKEKRGVKDEKAHQAINKLADRRAELDHMVDVVKTSVGRAVLVDVRKEISPVNGINLGLKNPDASSGAEFASNYVMISTPENEEPVHISILKLAQIETTSLPFTWRGDQT